MQSVFSKDHEGIAQNPMVPWWSVGQPTAYVETLGQLKDINVEQHASANQIMPDKLGEGDLEQSLSKGNPAQFTIFPGKLILPFFIFMVSVHYIT